MWIINSNLLNEQWDKWILDSDNIHWKHPFIIAYTPKV